MRTVRVELSGPEAGLFFGFALLMLGVIGQSEFSILGGGLIMILHYCIINWRNRKT